MRSKLLTLAALVMLGASAVHAQDLQNEARRFTLAYLTYFPGSTVSVTVDSNGVSMAGPYQVLTAVRSRPDNTNPAQPLKDQLSLLADPMTRTFVAGVVFPLDNKGTPVTPDTLPRFVEDALPGVLQQLFSNKTKVAWPGTPTRLTAVIPLTAEVASGYGWMKIPVAVTADGKYIAVGGSWPVDRDPRAVRRERLADAPIEWDPGHENAPLKLVEFSDYECPACKRGWSEVKPVLAAMGDKVRHGMVNFPLVMSHPWAFRAAVAGYCVYKLWPGKAIDLKEDFYRLQDSLSVGTLDDAVFGFLKQQDLDANAFRGCYLNKDYLADKPLDAVLAQLAAGYGLGVFATPTYFVNGEAISFSDKKVAEARMNAIAAAGGVPENAPAN